MSLPSEPDPFIPEDRQALERLTEELRFRGYADRTQEGYFFHVRRFLRSLYSDGEESADGVRQFFLHCRDELGHSLIYIHQAICALRFFYRYIRPDVANVARFPSVRRPRRLPVVLSRMEVASVFAHSKSLRKRALLMFVYASGLRVSEVVKVRRRDLDEKTTSLRVPHGKGGSDRYTLLSPIALAEIRKHWPEKRFEGWIFPGATPGCHISTRTVQRAFNQARDAAGIRKKATLHTLRHSFATHLLERGTPLLYLQKFLGHATPRSTLRYIHVTKQELGRVRSPLDDLVEGGPEEKKDGGSQLALRLEPDYQARVNGQFSLASDTKKNYANSGPR